LAAAARSLFARRGIEGVSLREITRAAEQGNTRALQYHFGDRGALLAAVVAPYEAEVGSRRSALLDELDARPDLEMREVASALVRPSAAMLDVDGGKDYLRIMAEVVSDPRRYVDEVDPIHPGLDRWVAVASRLMPAEVDPLHRRFAAMQLCASELGRRSATERRKDHRLFVSDLTDLVAAILDAPVSSETSYLLAERESG
jgi:AcrR family transcriptional regulator